LTARGRITTHVPLLLAAAGANGQAAMPRFPGFPTNPGFPGTPGGQKLMRGWGGDGGNGSAGGGGGYGGQGACGSGGGGGTVRLAATIMNVSLTANLAGGSGGLVGGTVPGHNGQNGRLLLARDAGNVGLSGVTGDTVLGDGADVGLHQHAVHLGTDAPLLGGLAQGIEASGLLAESPVQLGMTAAGRPSGVLGKRSVTMAGDAYLGYDLILLAADGIPLHDVQIGCNGAQVAALVTGTGAARGELDLLSAEQVYAFLAPGGDTTLDLLYGFEGAILECRKILGPEVTLDLVSVPHERIQILGTYHGGHGPGSTKSLTVDNTGTWVVAVTNAASAGGGCDHLEVTNAAQMGGTLRLDFTGYPTPSLGEEYCFISAGALAGQFSALQVVGLDQNQVSYDMTGGTFRIVPAVPDEAAPRITHMDVLPDGRVRLDWNAVSNQTYRVEMSSGPWAAAWSNLTGTIVALGPTASATDPGPVPVSRQYRVVTP